MRRPVLAFVMVAIVVVAAQPAGAIDNGFEGWYRLIARLTAGACRDDYTQPVYVRYVDERVRVLRHPEEDRRFRYVRGERFPWQNVGAFYFVLRYDPATESAVGVRQHPEGCRWHMRLVPVG